MKPGVTFKLFLVILATCITVVLSMGIAVRWSFERDFFQYVQERDAELVSRLQVSLAAVYREHGDWTSLSSNGFLWHQLMRRPLPLDGESDMAPEKSEGIPPSADDEADDEADDRADDEADDSIPGPNPHANRPHPPPPPPYSLLDAAGQYIAGARFLPAHAPRHAIDVAGRTVGWLITPFPERLPDDADHRFQLQQGRATWIIACASVLLAAMVSLLLARIFVAPLRRLALATHRLTAGDYSARIPVSSSDELGTLTQDFNRLAGTLERNEHLRRNLMADISHELRTPLAVLRGELEALQDGVRELNPQALSSLQSEVGLLSKLIDDLYELSLADAGALTYRMQPIDISALVAEMMDSFYGRYRARSIALSLNAPGNLPAVDGDVQRLAQLLNNLLENSLRYTDHGGQLQVSLHAGDGRVHIDFQDSAPGVEPEMLPRLFERLFRTDESRNRESGGTGLGLTICQSIVRSHGGAIQAMRSPLGGVRIHVALPEVRKSSPDTGGWEA